MTVNKRKKNTRFRGTQTHGYGSKKKHRGAGSRGGRGGTGKRGDSLKPSIWKDTDYFGKHGFKVARVEKIKAINIRDIQDGIKNIVKRGLAKEEKGSYSIDLKELGYNKLLSTGKVKDKLSIKVKYASAKAIEKIEKAGGKVEVQVIKSEEKPAEDTDDSPEEENKED